MDSNSGKKLHITVLLGIIILSGLLLRITGASEETRILWDESRPEIEVFLSNPVGFTIDILEKSMGRPGLIMLKLFGLLVSKLRYMGTSGFPHMPQ